MQTFEENRPLNGKIGESKTEMLSGIGELMTPGLSDKELVACCKLLLQPQPLLGEPCTVAGVEDKSQCFFVNTGISEKAQYRCILILALERCQ